MSGVSPIVSVTSLYIRRCATIPPLFEKRILRGALLAEEPLSSRLINPVDERRHSADFRAALQLLPQSLGDSERRCVVGMDDADHVISAHLIEGVLQEKPAAFRRESFSLKSRGDRPAYLESGPVFGIREPDPADEPARRFLLRHEISVAEQLPVSDEISHVSPGFESRQWLPTYQVAHDVWIRAQPEVIVEITETVHS